MVNQGRGRLFRRKDGKWLIYLPKDLCEDSLFPFKDLMKEGPRVKDSLSLKVNVSFSAKEKGLKALLITTN
jgi:hypothetical protein